MGTCENLALLLVRFRRYSDTGDAHDPSQNLAGAASANGAAATSMERLSAVARWVMLVIETAIGDHFEARQLVERDRSLPVADADADVDLHIDDSERRADLISEGIDLLVRIGNLTISDLIAREIFCTQGLTVASPAYLKRNGEPRHPDELRDHDLIDFSHHGTTQSWSYPGKDGDVISVPNTPRVRCNDAHTEKALALAGCVITRLPQIVCQAELDAGSLMLILPDFRSPPVRVHVTYASRDNLPAKTRAMIDFLIEKIS